MQRGVSSRKQRLGKGHEENVPAESKAKESNARLSRENEEQSGTSGDRPPEAKRAASLGGVTIITQRLRRSERIDKRADFDKVYKNGSRIYTKFLVAFVLAKTEGRLRVGVVASRKVGKAVARNQAKRLLREVFRRNRPRQPVSVDVVLVARSSIVGADYDAVQTTYVQEVCPFIEKAGKSRG